MTWPTGPRPWPSWKDGPPSASWPCGRKGPLPGRGFRRGSPHPAAELDGEVLEVLLDGRRRHRAEDGAVVIQLEVGMAPLRVPGIAGVDLARLPALHVEPTTWSPSVSTTCGPFGSAIFIR